jgi:hypothetical protein
MKPSKSKRERPPDLNFIAPLSLEECRERLTWMRERSHSIFSRQEWNVKVDIQHIDQHCVKFRIEKFVRTLASAKSR